MKRLKARTAETAHDESREFERLFQEHWASVYRILQRLVGDPAEAEDLALEAFLRLYRQIGRQTEGMNAGGWLYRAATRLGLHAIRSRKRREHYELTAGRYALDESEQPSPADIFVREEERMQVRLVLSQMNERQSQILILRHSGLSYREIAETLNLAPGSIGPLLVRAEREFEKQYRALVKEA